MLLRKVLVLAALVCLLVFAQRTGGAEIRYEIFDTDESLDYQGTVGRSVAFSTHPTRLFYSSPMSHLVLVVSFVLHSSVGPHFV